MKELPHGSLLPVDSKAFPEKAARFVLKKAVGVIPASVLIFAGCSVGSGAENNPQDLERQPSGYTLPLRMEESSAAEREPKSLEQQANAVALDMLISLLSETQSGLTPKGPWNLETKLTSTILDPELVNGQLAGFPRNEIVKGRQAANDNLLFNWVYSIKLLEGNEYNNNNDLFGRNVGQGEIKNIKINSSASPIPLTEADKANGVQWKGGTNMTYIARWRFLVPFAGLPENYSNIWYSGTSGTDEEWAKTHTQLTEPFTEWEDVRTTIGSMLRNGKWTSEFVSYQNNGMHYPIPASAYTTTVGDVNTSCESPPVKQFYTQVLERVPGCESFVVKP